MSFIKSAVAALTLTGAVVLFSAPAQAGLVLTNGGQTVDDTAQGVTWLENADLAAQAATNPLYAFKVATCNAVTTSDCINANGSMDYLAAENWVKGLNAYDGGKGYLGHANWQLPTTPTQPTLDNSCSSIGGQGNSFAYNCRGSALGALYKTGLHLNSPTTSLSPATTSAAGFANLQFAQYWTGTQATKSGYHTFNFATGWSGANQGANGIETNPSSPNFGNITPHGVIANFFYVLPMLTSVTPDPNNPNLNSELVHDPNSGDYFLADGNFGATIAANPNLQTLFGLTVCSGGIGAPNTAPTPPCVNTDGSMTWTSANALTTAMQNVHYLGQSGWELPPSTEGASCSFNTCADTNAKAAEDPLASLFYNVLQQPAGGSAASVATGNSGPFIDLQPNLYWACPAVQPPHGYGPPTSAALACDPNPQCEPPSCFTDMGWSLNFGDGFQGTDEEGNDLFVTAYYVDSVPEAPTLVTLLPVLGFVAATLGRRRRIKASDHISRRQ